MDRTLGTSLNWEASAGYRLGGGFDVGLLYEGSVKAKDDYESIADALEEETDASSHLYKIRVGYSTLPLFLKKEFPIPLVFSLAFQDRFAGKNVLKSQYVELGVGAYF